MRKLLVIFGVGLVVLVLGLVYLWGKDKLPASFTQKTTSFTDIISPSSEKTSLFESFVEFKEGASFGADTSLVIDGDGNLTTEGTVTTGDMRIDGTAFLENVNLSSSLYVSGNQIIDSSGRIPGLTVDYFASLDGSAITNVDAHHLGGVAASSFIRSDQSDEANAAITFNAIPGSANVGGGPLYINPGSTPGGGYTLLGAAVNGSEKFRLDASGNISFSGTMTGTLNPSFTTGSVIFQGSSGLAQDNSSFFWDDTNNLLGIGGFAPAHKLFVTGHYAGNALAAFDETGSNDIFTASASGTPRFVINNAGKVGVGTTTPYGLIEVSSGSTPSIFLRNTAWNADLVYGLRVSNSARRLDFTSVQTDGDPTSVGQTHMSLDFLTGNIGIGDDTPTETLTVADNQAGYAGSFFSSGGADDRQGVFIRGCLNTNPTSACNFLELRDGDGTVLGAIEGNGAGGVTNASTGSDYAELFSGDKSQVEPGDILGLNSDGKAVKATSETRLIGAYSSTSSNLGNWKDGWETENNLVPVALLGQVRVKVVNDNGRILKSDPIGISPTHPGIGTKATASQRIMGYALEEAPDTDGIHQILIAVSPSWHQSVNFEDKLTKLETELLLLKGNQILGTTTQTPTATTQTLTTFQDVVITGKLDIGTLKLDGFENSLNAVGTLKIQPLALGDIEFLGGRMKLNKEGSVVLDVKGGLRLDTEGKEKPECTADIRGTFWYSQKEAEEDLVEVCKRLGDGTFGWDILD